MGIRFGEDALPRDKAERQRLPSLEDQPENPAALACRRRRANLAQEAAADAIGAGYDDASIPNIKRTALDSGR